MIDPHMIELTQEPIAPEKVMCHVASRDAGAVVLFVGTAREFTQGRRTLSLDYDCYRPMAVAKLTELEQEAQRRWPLQGVCVVHRLGQLEIGEASIAIAVSSAHRQAAFEAGNGSSTRSNKSFRFGKKKIGSMGQASGCIRIVAVQQTTPHEVERGRDISR